MKHLLTISALIFIFTGHGICQSPAPGASDFKKLAWISGTWTRTNAKAGRSGQELWEKTSDTEWKGRGVNMKGADTAFVEKLKVVVKDGNIYYVADIVENKVPVYFKFTQLTEKGFVCENPEHDFPKKIAYSVEGQKLKATISGGGKSIDYLFVRK